MGKLGSAKSEASLVLCIRIRRQSALLDTSLSMALTVLRRHGKSMVVR